MNKKVKEVIAKELVLVAKDLVGADNDYLVSDRDFTKVATSAIKNIGGDVTGVDAYPSVNGRLPYAESDSRYKLTIMFLYKHYPADRDSDQVNVTFGIYTQMNNKRNNVYKEFSTFRGDSEEKAFKRFARFCKNTLPRHFEKLVKYGQIVPVE